MRKSLVSLLAFVLIYTGVIAQDKQYIQPATFGIHFLFNDFETATAIRSSSLSSVINNKQFGKLKNMDQGLALSYGKGLSRYFDFTSMLAGSFLDYPVPGKDDDAGQNLLLEADASIRGKMFSDRYWFNPYLQLGVGVSKYQGYFGTFMPVGVGIQINFFDEAYLLINSQYRVAISESTNYHFVHSIGLVGNIGKKEE